MYNNAFAFRGLFSMETLRKAERLKAQQLDDENGRVACAQTRLEGSWKVTKPYTQMQDI